LSKELPADTEVYIYEKPLYEEGDNVLIPAKPLLNTPVPMATLSYASTSVRVEISQNEESLSLLLRKEGMEDISYGPYSLRGKSLKAVLDEIVGDDIKFSYVARGTFSLIDIAAESLFPVEKGFNPRQLPYTFSTSPTLVREEGLLSDFLKSGEDYEIVDGGIIVLAEGHRQDVRYYLTYASPKSIAENLTVAGKRFVGVPQGAQFHITTDYLARDQFLIEAKKEWDYLASWVLPYLEKKKQSLKGPKTQGSAGISAGSSDGILKGTREDNYSLVRDLYLSASLLWKISEYYKNRMQAFSKEYEALRGFVIGNTRDAEIYTWYDVNHQSTFGISKFFPLNYEKDSPKEDGRFAEELTPFDTCAIYNDSASGYLSGYLYSPYANFTEEAKGVAVGDSIKVQGDATLYTITEIVSETTLKVNTTFSFGGDTIPESAEGSFVGIPYRIFKQEPLNIGFADDKGNMGACLVSTVNQSIRIQNTTPKTKFQVQLSLDEGSTWENFEVTFENEIMGLEEIANRVNEKLYENFVVTVEDVYAWEGLSEEVNKAIDIGWPLSVPDVGATPGYRRSLVLRATNPLGWVKVIENSLTLGFEYDTEFKGARNVSSCISLYDMEIAKREDLRDTLDNILGVTNKILRGSQENKNALILEVEEAKDIAGGLKNKIKSAIDGATLLFKEIDATPAIGTTHSQAISAIDEYTIRKEGTDIIIDEDKDTLGSLSGYEGSYICSVEESVITREGAQAAASLAYSTSGEALLTFNALDTKESQYDPRILFGDKTMEPSVPLGSDGSSIVVFPKYRNNTNFLGNYTMYPRGAWASPTIGEGYSITASEGFRMEDALTVTATSSGYSITSDTDGLTITGSSSSQTFNYGLYSTLGTLINALNEFTSEVQFTTEYPLNTAYGVLLSVSKPLDAGVPYAIPFGIRGDIEYYIISDYELMQERARQQSRVVVLQSERPWLLTRQGQLETQFGEGGEKLPRNRRDWMNRLLHKTLGVTSSILPLKKIIREANENE